MPEAHTIPRIHLRGEVEIPQLGLRRLPGPARGDREDVAARARGRLPPHRHRRGVPQRGAASARPCAPPASTATRSSSPRSCCNDDHGYDEATRALDASLERLEMDHVDLYLIHWPVPATGPLRRDVAGAHRAAAGGPGARDRRLELPARRTCARIIDETGVTPAVNQVELHPLPRSSPGCAASTPTCGIVTEAWSPLAQGAVLDDPAITEIAAAHEPHARPGRAALAPAARQRRHSRSR